jgi:hypothetical protein
MLIPAWDLVIGAERERPVAAEAYDGFMGRYSRLMNGQERWQQVEVPISPALWDVWGRYCEVAGIIHYDYDNKSHSATAWQRDYYSGISKSTTWSFTTNGSKQWEPNFSRRIDAMTSSVTPIHDWHDLVYPRFKHGIDAECVP